MLGIRSDCLSGDIEIGFGNENLDKMITLINPPSIKTFSGLNMQTPNPPLGLAYVAASLKEAGYPCHVIDGTGNALDRIQPYPGRADFLVQGLSPRDIADRVPSDATAVGIGCMFSTLWPLVRMVAEAVRARLPDVLLVLGGEHGTAVPEYSLRNGPFNAIILGEGEETFINLLRAHAAGRSFHEVKGIAFLDGGRYVNTGLSPRIRVVDDIPPPDWDALPIEEYIARHQINGINLGRSMPLLATRGCPYQCTFCSSPNMWTRRYIARNPKLVVDEMERYIRTYRVSNFDFQDLTAVVKRIWVVEFCQELIDRGLNITWQMPSGTRCEIFDEEVAELLYRSGCRALAFAPESGDPEILEKVQKQVDLEKFFTAAEIAVKQGLKLSCFFVIGFPDDTPMSLNKTMKLLRKLALLGVHDVAVTKFIPYPGSELFQRLQADGKIQLDDEFFVSPMDYYSNKAPSYADAISTRRLYWTMIWMFVNFYVISFARRPFRVLKSLAVAVLNGAEETRYAKWFVDRIYTRRRWKSAARRTAAGRARRDRPLDDELRRPLRMKA